MTDPYENGKPSHCRYCYFYIKRRCSLAVCYYERPAPRKPVSECDGCPYGAHSPCIGWCTKEALRFIGREV